MMSSPILLNGLAGKENGLGLLSYLLDNIGYSAYQGGHKFPKSFNYKQIARCVDHPKNNYSISTPIEVGTFASYFLTLSQLSEWLVQLKRGEYVQGHLPYRNELATLLTNYNYHHIVILRDPRIVMVNILQIGLAIKTPNFGLTVSGTHMRCVNGSGILQDDLATMDIKQRFEIIAFGGYLPIAAVTINPFKQFYEQMAAWQNQKLTFTMQYEQLSDEQVARNLLNYLGSDDQFSALRPLLPRQQQSIPWQLGLDPDIIKCIDQYCRPLCQMTGYLEN